VYAPCPGGTSGARLHLTTRAHLRSSSSSRVRWRLLRCDLRSRSFSSSLCRCDLWLLRCLRSPFSSPSAFSAAPLRLPASSCASSRSYLCEAHGRRQCTTLSINEHLHDEGGFWLLYCVATHFHHEVRRILVTRLYCGSYTRSWRESCKVSYSCVSCPAVHSCWPVKPTWQLRNAQPVHRQAGGRDRKPVIGSRT
jgi:hypothetical protein